MMEALLERVEALERKLAKVEYTVDGFGEHSLDATAQLTGLLVHFLQANGLVDQAALRTFLARFAGSEAGFEDPVEALVARVIDILDFQKLHPEDYV